MKRNVIYIFAMVLWFLVFSTIFSLRVELLMIPIVTESAPYTTPASTAPRLDLDCLFTDEDGAPVLYQTYEGLAWDAGLRVKMAAPASYTILEDHISYNGLEPVVQYATKELKLGEKIIVAAKTDSRDDLYLAVCPTEVRLQDDLPKNLAVLARTENALLAKESQAPSIFMPKRAVGELFQHQPLMLPDERVYSLADVDSFFGALPLAALLPGIMLFVLILWMFSFPLLKDLQKNCRMLIGNSCLAAAALLILSVLLHYLRFPSSLLPKDNIVDASHYIRKFSEVFSALRLFADAGEYAAEASLSHAYAMMWFALGITLLCVLLAAVIILIQWRFRRVAKRR